jgi:hypothetical protein
MQGDNMMPGGGTAAAATIHDSTSELFSHFSQPAKDKANGSAIIADMFSDSDKKEDTASGDDKPGKEGKRFVSSELSAELLIGSIDTLQTIAFSAANRRKMKRRFADDIDRLEVLVDKIDAGTMTKADLSDQDHAALKKLRRLIAVYDDIPFTDEEKEQLKKPLAEIIEVYGAKIPPGVALVIAALTVMLPRIVDMAVE